VKNENNPQDDLLKDFLAESLENIEHAEQGLLALEQDGDSSGIHDIFRAVHSIKGAFATCAKIYSGNRKINYYLIYY